MKYYKATNNFKDVAIYSSDGISAKLIGVAKGSTEIWIPNVTHSVIIESDKTIEITEEEAFLEMV